MDERSLRAERLLEVPVLIAAALVVPILVIQGSSYGEPWEAIASFLNWATWLVFLGEAVVMLSIVPDRRAWLRRHPIDLAVVVLTPPFFAAFTPVRLLRLLRLLRLARFGPAARRLLSLEGLRYAGLLAALTAVAGGAAFAALEKGQTTGNGIYWALTTMTTVGYGDPSPTTNGTKVLAVIVALVGIGFVAIVTGAIAQRFVSTDVRAEEHEAVEIDEQIAAEVSEIRNRLESLEGLVAQRRAG